jgi:hypothetical protein
VKKEKQYKEKYKQLKHQVQKEQRNVYNTYIEKIILDLPTNDTDQSINNQSKPKKLFSFIKSLRTDNSGVAPLKKVGQSLFTTESFQTRA